MLCSWTGTLKKVGVSWSHEIIFNFINKRLEYFLRRNSFLYRSSQLLWTTEFFVRWMCGLSDLIGSTYNSWIRPQFRMAKLSVHASQQKIPTLQRKLAIGQNTSKKNNTPARQAGRQLATPPPSTSHTHLQKIQRTKRKKLSKVCVVELNSMKWRFFFPTLSEQMFFSLAG